MCHHVHSTLAQNLGFLPQASQHHRLGLKQAIATSVRKRQRQRRLPLLQNLGAITRSIGPAFDKLSGIDGGSPSAPTPSSNFLSPLAAWSALDASKRKPRRAMFRSTTP